MYVINPITKIVNVWENTEINRQRLASGKYGVIKYEGEVKNVKGMLYAAKYAPLEDFSKVVEIKNNEINSWREEARTREYAEFNGAFFGVREQDQNNINSQVVIANLMLMNKVPVVTQLLRDANNNNHILSPEEIIAVGLAIGEKVTEIYQHSWELKELTALVKTPEQLDSLYWRMDIKSFKDEISTEEEIQ